MILDGAGWHHAHALEIPENMVLLFLPPYSPELNPVEHIWGHLRDYYFRNRTFENLDAVEEALMDGLVNLINTPELVKSMALFSWLKTLW
jgi:transposase